MGSEGTAARLRAHAGLDAPREAAAATVASCTGTASARWDELENAVDDFIDALGALNRELNGKVPSASTAGPAAIPRDIAYAVAEVARMLRNQPGAGRAAWSVETAWLAVLAGDIDDLPEHLAEEEAAREPLA